MTSRTIDLGPTTATLTLHTGRQGAAAKVGHDLVLGVGAWNGTVTLDGTTVTALRVHAETSSLTVLEGHGGLKPLSDKDKAKIESEATATLKSATVELTVATAVDGVGQGALVGDLTIGGKTQPFTLQFETTLDGGAARVQAHGEIVQTAFGIKPYSAMLGALKVRDLVEVRIEVTATLPT